MLWTHLHDPGRARFAEGWNAAFGAEFVVLAGRSETGEHTQWWVRQLKAD